MFTQPSVNQIASAYQGNPAPLAQKVDADKKQHGGIPQDLRQLLALNDITQGRNAMGIQQALQIPTNMPTVAQSLQQQAQQAIQARLMQQAREQQRLNQQPPAVPPGTPRPKEQPQGLDALQTNVGEEYAHGGIIPHFDGKTNGSQVIDPMLGTMVSSGNLGEDDQTILEKLGVFNPANRRANERLERILKEKEAGTSTSDQVDRGRLRDPRASANVFPDAETQLKEAAQAAAQKTAQGGPRVNVPAQPGAITNLVPAADTEALSILKKDMRRDPEAEAAALRAKYLQEVGKRDLSIYDKTAAELQARKEKLNAPKAGYDAMMEYLEQVALGGGRRSAESGAIGAARQRQLQLNREAQQNEIMDKILDLGAKKAEAEYGEKKGLFELTQAERKSVYEKAYEAAKSVNVSDDKAKELAQQAVLEREKMANQRAVAAIGAHDNLMSRAQALMKVDPKLGLEGAMRKAAEIAATGQMESANVARQKNIEKAIAEIDKGFPLLEALSLNPNNPKYIKMKAERDQKVAESLARQGLSDQGINALPTSTGLPAGVTVTQVK